MDYLFHCDSPLGPILLSSDGNALTGLWFHGQAHFAATLGPDRAEADLPVFTEAVRWLDGYFRGEIPDFLPPMVLRGTPFQQTVWQILLTIPYGQTMTYGQIARMLEDRREYSRMSAQAVGNAVGRNPISLLVPCHRVVGAGGRLTGYAGGIHRKQWLLNLEKDSKTR